MAQEQRRAVPCGGETLARGTVSRVVDGRTFVLDDEREVRLAAIEVPPLSSPQEPGTAPGGTAARDALAALLAGAEIVLKRAEAPSDRYGRVLAYAFPVRGGIEHSAQAELISAGLARVAARIGNRDCAAELLGRERAVRQAKPSQAKPSLAFGPVRIMICSTPPTPPTCWPSEAASRWSRVRWCRCRESGATIYVNFGRRWTEDFTVTILKRSERTFTAAGMEPKRLAGRRVRVRGWIEERGGPWIEAAHPEQIELTDRE